MTNLLAVVLAFAVVAFLIPWLAKHADALGLVDHPGGRKHHPHPTPVIGGIAIFFGLSIGVLLVGNTYPEVLAVISGAGLIMLLGVVDDRSDISANLRITLQAGIALLVIVVGDVSVTQLGDIVGTGGLGSGPFAIPFSVVAIVGVINAFNMIDGTDGLAGGLALVSSALVAIASLASGFQPGLTLAICLAAATAGFLLYNLRHPWRHKAAVFMGDAGSMVLGLVIACLLIMVTQSDTPAISPMTSVWILALPLLDMGAIMIRRMLKGRSPFSADREHLHHILLASGLSVGKTVMLMLGVATLLGAGGMMAHWAGVPDYVLFVAFLLTLAVYVYAMSHAWRLMRAMRTALHNEGRHY